MLGGFNFCIWNGRSNYKPNVCNQEGHSNVNYGNMTQIWGFILSYFSPYESFNDETYDQGNHGQAKSNVGYNVQIEFLWNVLLHPYVTKHSKEWMENEVRWLQLQVTVLLNAHLCFLHRRTLTFHWSHHMLTDTFTQTHTHITCSLLQTHTTHVHMWVFYLLYD